MTLSMWEYNIVVHRVEVVGIPYLRNIRFIQATEDMDAMVPDMEGYSPSNVEKMGDSQSEAVPEEEGAQKSPHKSLPWPILAHHLDLLSSLSLLSWRRQQFTSTSLFKDLHETFWSIAGADADLGEAPALLIETVTPNDGWLTRKPGVEHRYGQSPRRRRRPELREDVGEGPATIRHIHPKTHPALAVHKLGVDVDHRGDKATSINRHEHGLFMFMERAMAHHPPSDTFGCHYCLLASGQSVFYLTDPTTILLLRRWRLDNERKSPRKAHDTLRTSNQLGTHRRR
ncbi:hypothetical protein B0H14DRAFT_3851358 [Mycena olivaceomarginata]|nr:hypothetical protein B0H14DRAFT_3851358 [Mycena olivaceomarginata]